MIFSKYLGASAVVVLLGASGALAQDRSVYYSPQVSADLQAPSYFDGLYAGVMTGTVSSRWGNFYTAGQPLRTDFTLVGGYNQSFDTGLVASGEVQASVGTDFFDATDFDAMAIARLGVLSDHRFMTYGLAGIGYFADAPAFEVGMGYEWLASRALSLRLEGMGIGQLGNVPNGNNVPGISAVRLTAGAMWHIGAPDQGFDPPPDNGVTDFTGPYAGLYTGAYMNPSYNFFPDHGFGGHLSRVAFGGMAGWNYALSDTFRAGGEVQGGLDFDSSGDAGIDALAMGRVGVVPMEGLMPYATAGLGVLGGQGAYALGGGVEYAAWGQNSLRAEALGIGELGNNSGSTGISAGKVTFGTLFHFN
jgi:opacity protein-like surface antigen